MVKPFPWFRLALWLLVLLLLLAAWLLPPWLDDDTYRRIARTGVLRVGLDPAYPPFESTVGDEVVGYDVDLAHALGQALDLQVVLVSIGYDSLYEALVSGEIDVILSSYPYSPELCNRERCTRPYFQAGQVLVVRAGSNIAGPPDLVGRTVGVERGGPGDVLARAWEEAGRLGTRTTFMTPAEALAALAAGQVDAVVVDRLSALSFAAGQEGLVILEPAVQDESFVAVVAARSAWLHGRLEWALEQLAGEGTLAMLEARWCRQPSR